MDELKVTRGSDNVFEDLGFSPQKARSLFLRSEVMIALIQWYRTSGLTQVAAAEVLGINRNRLNQLLKGEIEQFCLDALLDMATSARLRV